MPNTRFQPFGRFKGGFCVLVAAATLFISGCALVPTEAGDLGYDTQPYALSRAGSSPYIGPHVIALNDTTWGKVNEAQVLEVILGGKKVYHPVNSAWWMNQMISSYKVTRDPRYLTPVIQTAKYLIRYSVTDKNGTWFKYDFEYTHGGDKFRLKPGWVSGMAQGMMLSTFVNLYEVTDDPYWKHWADQAYKTYKAPKSSSAPWFQDVRVLDGKKFLFFEEYPAPEEQISHVVNGNMYAMYGLYDYYRLTGSGEAQWLFNTAATSLRDSFASYRNPGNPSWYATTSYGRTVWKNPANYHKGVTSMLRKMGDLTGDHIFYQQSDTLAADYR